MRVSAVALVLLLSGSLLVAEVQPAGKVPRVGYILVGPPECKLAPRDEAFYQSLRDFGYIPGQNSGPPVLQHGRRDAQGVERVRRP
jgi:hypothetical protein